MSCPSWEDCNKKSCIEEYVCMNGDYWARYWQRQKNNNTPLWQQRKQAKKSKRAEARAFHFKERSACVKSGDWCDKKESCAVLGQCIITIPRIANNPALIESLKGKLDPGAVIKRLRDHDPEPMASYYAGQKK